MDVFGRLKELNLHPKHSLGQNFMSDDHAADLIIEAAEPKKGDVFLEVGPGLGVLTERLLKKGMKVIAVELDPMLHTELSIMMQPYGDQLDLWNDDIMNVDLGEMEFNKIISNLPYQISSPFTFKILEEAKFDLAVITYQLEFARRLVGFPGGKEYSRLSVMAYYKAEIEMIKRLKAGAFYPPPKVDSGVVKITPREKPPFELDDEKYFEIFVRELFNHRRKKIRSSLKKSVGFLSRGKTKEEFVAALEGLDNMDKRPEELTPEEMGELCNALLKRLG